MLSHSDIMDHVLRIAGMRILYLPHAVRQMSRPDRLISTVDIRNVLKSGELMEGYPEDVRGHSCLILGYRSDNTPIHIVCSPKTDYLAVITAYAPDPDEWENDFKKRKKT